MRPVLKAFLLFLGWRSSRVAPGCGTSSTAVSVRRSGLGTGTKDGETATWHLVHFIRRLPRLTPEELEEMESLNPRPPAEIRQQIAEEAFLKGSGDQPPPKPVAPHKH
jgi:hypothetical protein